MELTPEMIKGNWDSLMGYIETYIQSPRKEQLLKFYEKHEDRLILMPASIKKEYHGAFPGGYVNHVCNVIQFSLLLSNVWDKSGADMSTFTKEELVFSALNHDLGKMGDEDNEAYIPQTDQWRKDKLGEDYTFNKELAFASIPDRSLFLLQSNGIQYSFNEMIAIQTHDGLYDEGNKKYLMSYQAETKPRTNLVFILHQADLMAARIEFEQEWKGKFSKNNLAPVKEVGKFKSTNKKVEKGLSSVKSSNLMSFLDKVVE